MKFGQSRDPSGARTRERASSCAASARRMLTHVVVLVPFVAMTVVPIQLAVRLATRPFAALRLAEI
jgi:hypothetical protein